MDFSHYVAELMLSGKLNPEDFFNEHEKARFREALSQIDSKEFNVLLKKYESVAGRLNLGSRSIATLLLLMVAAGNLSLAAHQFMREKKQKGGVDLDGALKRLTRQGKVPSPAEVLKEAGVPAAYAALLGLSRSGAGWDVKKWFAQNAAESGLKGGTRRDVRRAQPLKPEQLVSYLADCMLKRQRPLLYGFWGGHKENESGFADEHDETALTNLKKTVDAMSQQGLKPPKMKLIFADKHSQDFNGIPSDKTERYYRSISRLAKKHGFELVRLSDLYGDRTWRKFAPQVRVLSDEHAERLLKNPELRRTLSASAQKHSTLIEDGKASVDQVVEKYVRERVFEGFMLSLHPKWQGIHWTYSDPKLNELLPRVPTLFLHSIARSTSASPWFLDAAKPARHSPVQERREAA
ncbi:TPA: hypothetical protein HA244_02200 [Candidatus Micrarchaeota archaeon]|nr:hypothetical protein [Candidatus Micrarchaeota archaeon]